MSDRLIAVMPPAFRHAPETDEPPYVLTPDSTSFDSRGP
jgi:hypothetical protein